MQMIILILLAIFAQSGEVTQGRIYQLGTGNNYVAGVYNDDEMRHFPALRSTQSNDMWCWAACVQMVVHFQGLYIEQCEIVNKSLGTQNCPNRPGSCYNIQSAASNWIINGRRVTAEIKQFPSASDLIHQLAYKYPVIIGLDMPGQNIGHAYVLTAVYFRRGANQEPIPYRVVLRDPWPYAESRQEFEWNDFRSRVNCIVHVSLN